MESTIQPHLAPSPELIWPGIRNHSFSSVPGEASVPWSYGGPESVDASMRSNSRRCGPRVTAPRKDFPGPIGCDEHPENPNLRGAKPNSGGHVLCIRSITDTRVPPASLVIRRRSSMKDLDLGCFQAEFIRIRRFRSSPNNRGHDLCLPRKSDTSPSRHSLVIRRARFMSVREQVVPEDPKAPRARDPPPVYPTPRSFVRPSF
jgi:hypothetical protein